MKKKFREVKVHFEEEILVTFADYVTKNKEDLQQLFNVSLDFINGKLDHHIRIILEGFEKDIFMTLLFIKNKINLSKDSKSELITMVNYCNSFHDITFKLNTLNETDHIK